MMLKSTSIPFGELVECWGMWGKVDQKKLEMFVYAASHHVLSPVLS